MDDDEVDRRSFSREVVDGVDLSEVNVSSCVFDHVSFSRLPFPGVSAHGRVVREL